jgi:hypothetical protein
VTDGERLLGDHVERFNEGVRSGDFAPMVAAFADDAEMIFEGVPAGPFVGRDAIGAAYREQPPDDEIVLLAAPDEGDDGVVRTPYAWASAAGTEAGEMRLTPDGGRIARLVVTFER